MATTLVNVAQFYSDVLDPFHALLFFLLGAVLYFRTPSTSRRSLLLRLSTLSIAYIVAGGIALAIYNSFVSPPDYVFDVVAAGGALIGLAVISVIWYTQQWGDELLVMIGFLAIVTVVFGIISPFWNFSGHVSLIAAPCAYLLSIDRQFLPLAVIPVLMVPSRVLVNEHTVLQATVALGTVALLAVFYHKYVKQPLYEVL